MYPDHGTITVDGKTIGKDLDFPDKMGALIENPGFMWHETGFENLWYLAKIRHCIQKSDVEDTMRLLELDPALKTKVGKYSLGMKQRLGIAQAIMEDPDLLILDEPMNGLDESGVKLIRNVIRKFRQPGKSCFWPAIIGRILKYYVTKFIRFRMVRLKSADSSTDI